MVPFGKTIFYHSKVTGPYLTVHILFDVAGLVWKLGKSFFPLHISTVSPLSHSTTSHISEQLMNIFSIVGGKVRTNHPSGNSYHLSH